MIRHTLVVIRYLPARLNANASAGTKSSGSCRSDRELFRVADFISAAQWKRVTESTRCRAVLSACCNGRVAPESLVIVVASAPAAKHASMRHAPKPQTVHYRSQPAPRRRAPGSVTNRSRVSNGEWILEGVDNRSPQCRRFRDLCRSFASQLGGDLSEPDKLQVRQAALLALRSEALQTAQVAGHAVDNDEVIRIGSELRRALAPIVTKGEQLKQPSVRHQSVCRSKAAGQAA